MVPSRLSIPSRWLSSSVCVPLWLIWPFWFCSFFAASVTASAASRPLLLSWVPDVVMRSWSFAMTCALAVLISPGPALSVMFFACVRLPVASRPCPEAFTLPPAALSPCSSSFPLALSVISPSLPYVPSGCTPAASVPMLAIVLPVRLRLRWAAMEPLFCTAAVPERATSAEDQIAPLFSI